MGARAAAAREAGSRRSRTPWAICHGDASMEVDLSAPSSRELQEVSVTWIAVEYLDDVESSVIAGWPAASERPRTGSCLRAALAGLVSCISLLPSAAGIFSLMSFTVTQRTGEIGIRTALGAEPRQIVFAVFARATTQLGIGLLAGCALAVLPGYPGERLTPYSRSLRSW